MRISKRSFLTRLPHTQDAVIKVGVGIVVFLTILLLLLVLVSRFYFGFQQEVNFDRYLSFQSDFIGSGVRELLMPIALLAIFSNTSLFRRIVTTQADSQAQWRFIMVLALIQFLTSLYNLGVLMTTGNIVTTGTFVVIVAGLLGGVRSGLIIASVTVFVESLLGFYTLFPNVLTTDELNALISVVLLWSGTIFWGKCGRCFGGMAGSTSLSAFSHDRYRSIYSPHDVRDCIFGG